MTDTVARRRALLVGRVQGVGFRYFCREAAEEHGVRGWVRNRPDGSVELEAEAPPDALDAFLERLRRGHPWARVERIETLPLTPLRDSAESFEIR